MPADSAGFDSLIELMKRLRAPGGCPWDIEQTHESLRPYLIEEAYEVLEALDTGSDADLCDELGDVLLQVVFHAQLAAERNAFTIADVTEALRAKLVRRHPHVFGSTKASSAEQVKANWAKIKAEEKKGRSLTGAPPSILDGVPRGLPALTRAHRVGERAAEVGFDWPCAEACREKVSEELAELDEAASDGDIKAVADELGDLLFAVASYGRLSGLNAETVLERALGRFEARFRAVEQSLAESGSSVHEADSDTLEAVWQRVKRGLAASGAGDE